MRLLLAETAVITLAGALVGLLAAWWSLQGLLTLLPNGLPRSNRSGSDAGVAAFVVLVAVTTSAVAGLAPVLAVGRTDLLTPLRGGGRGVSGSPARPPPAHARGRTDRACRHGAGGGRRAHSQPGAAAVTRHGSRGRAPGVRRPRGSPVQLADRARHGQFLAQAVTRLESLSPIAGATPVNAAPFSDEGGWDVPRFTAEGQSEDLSATNPALNLESIHPNYFDTLGITLRRGRSFSEADGAGVPAVAIVSEDVAARVWPGRDPIGKRIKMGGAGFSRLMAHHRRRGRRDAISLAGHAPVHAVSSCRSVPRDCAADAWCDRQHPSR